MVIQDPTDPWPCLCGQAPGTRWLGVPVRPSALPVATEHISLGGENTFLKLFFFSKSCTFSTRWRSLLV